MAGNLIAAGINAGSSIANTLINQAYAERNRDRNFYWNDKAAVYADRRQRAQYFDLYSPQAMMEQYAAAGLSPSMMMSGGQSAVGQSSAQGNQSQGIQGPYPTAQVFDPLTAAQIANINADTKVKEEEASNIGEDTITKALDNFITSSTIPDTVERIKQEVFNLKADFNKTLSETSAIDWKNAFNLITQDLQVQELMNRNAELAAKVAELEARTQVHNADITLKEQERLNLIQKCKNMQEEITQKYIELDIYSDEQHAQEAWYEEQAFIMMKDFNLKQDMFNFESGEKFEFEKFKVGKQIQLAGWKLGLDFGSAMLQNVTNLVGTKQMGAVQKELKQMDINEARRPKTTNEYHEYYDRNGNYHHTKSVTKTKNY